MMILLSRTHDGNKAVSRWLYENRMKSLKYYFHVTSTIVQPNTNEKTKRIIFLKKTFYT